MKTLITNTRILHSSPQISLISRINPKKFNLYPRKWINYPGKLIICSATSADSMDFNGWDDPRLGGGSALSGESNQLRNLLGSLGIDQKRYVFVYLLGFICALAVSRIRVSSIIVFPACAIVFAVGFSIGLVNGGDVNELSLTGDNKRSKDDLFKVYTEKLEYLLNLFDGFNSKISDLKGNIKRGIESKHITMDDLETYLKKMSSIELSSLDGKSVVQTCIDSISIEKVEMEKLSNQKSSRKKKGVEGSKGDLFKLIIGSLFRKTSNDSKLSKTEGVKSKESENIETNNQSEGNILIPKNERKPVFSTKAEFAENDYNHPDESEFSDTGSGARKNFEGERFSYQGSRLRFTNSQRINMKMGPSKEFETWESSENFLDSVDFHVDSKTETFEKQEQMFGKINGKHRPRHSLDERENEMYRSHSEEESRVSFDDDSNTINYPFEPKPDEGSYPSALVSDDILFNKYLMEAKSLLKEAREGSRVKINGKKVETLLYDAAKVCSRAIEMKPMSLLGVGQLANTYLLHGELKFRKSRRLRALLMESDDMTVKRRGRLIEGADDWLEKRDRIASLLVRVCEECEELLVEAGKNYRLALSIDGNDMRAMYNWGLALSFRAQLIADIGPEAAFDADKIFLAAIDKFDAMMSKSNAYAPDALFRWGVALQQRSRLSPRNRNAKVKLLQQAKRLYEDALDMDSDNLQVKEALGSCISELDFRSY